MTIKQHADLKQNQYVREWLERQPSKLSQYSHASTNPQKGDASTTTFQASFKSHQSHHPQQSVADSSQELTFNSVAKRRIATGPIYRFDPHRQPHTSCARSPKLPDAEKPEAIYARGHETAVAPEDANDMESSHTVLRMGVTNPVFEDSLDHCAIRTSEVPPLPAAINAAETKYARQPRRKTREDKYEYKTQPSTKRSQPQCLQPAIRKKLKCGAGLSEDFTAPNITSERITLRRHGPGLFNKGKSSSTVIERFLQSSMLHSKSSVVPAVHATPAEGVQINKTRNNRTNKRTSRGRDLSTLITGSTMDRYMTPSTFSMSQEQDINSFALKNESFFEPLEANVTDQLLTWPRSDAEVQKYVVHPTNLLPFATRGKSKEEDRYDAAFIRPNSTLSFHYDGFEANALQTRDTEKAMSRSQLQADGIVPGTFIPAHDAQSAGCAGDYDSMSSTDAQRKPQSSVILGVWQKTRHVLSLEDLKQLAVAPDRVCMHEESEGNSQQPTKTDGYSIAPYSNSLTIMYEDDNTSPRMADYRRKSPFSSTFVTNWRPYHEPSATSRQKSDHMDIPKVVTPAFRVAGGMQVFEVPQARSVKSCQFKYSQNDHLEQDLDVFDVALLRQANLINDLPAQNTNPVQGWKISGHTFDNAETSMGSTRDRNTAFTQDSLQHAKSSQSSHVNARLSCSQSAKDTEAAGRLPPSLLRPSLCALDNLDHLTLFDRPHFA